SETVSYQGVLLDSGGLPRTGTVDLILRIYDAAASGTLVQKQESASVNVASPVVPDPRVRIAQGGPGFFRNLLGAE
ncbi:MAG: hypothetical protein OEP95_13415, partial [Myxococcales bacterium]|nr:hypothetical protein [Myxococcales bacterium]